MCPWELACWTTLLAYNLIRSTIALAATFGKVLPRTISVTSACQYVLASWQEFWNVRSEWSWRTYCEQLLMAISACSVSNRPVRFEPRVVKRRRDRYTLMTEPRSALRARLAKGDNAFELKEFVTAPRSAHDATCQFGNLKSRRFLAGGFVEWCDLDLLLFSCSPWSCRNCGIGNNCRYGL